MLLLLSSHLVHGYRGSTAEGGRGWRWGAPGSARLRPHSRVARAEGKRWGVGWGGEEREVGRGAGGRREPRSGSRREAGRRWNYLSGGRSVPQKRTGGLLPSDGHGRLSLPAPSGSTSGAPPTPTPPPPILIPSAIYSLYLYFFFLSSQPLLPPPPPTELTSPSPRPLWGVDLHGFLPIPFFGGGAGEGLFLFPTRGDTVVGGGPADGALPSAL